MELSLNSSLEFVPEPIAVSHFTTRGLLNSNYKSVVKQNFKTLESKSVFAIRQRTKRIQSHMVNYTAVILKLSVFAIALIALF
ncbi:hypothetical protein KO504_16205 [Winogradskyella psychrotolerans]|nr:hypothetical protein [Winogradskyella psychrotolerans]MBU2922893.1 hypothetical protein [Winogradskyella psychrotolerans]